MIPQVSSLITVGFGYHLTGFRSSFFARFSTMPAATPPRPPKAIQGIMDGIAEHGVDYDTDKVEALPQPHFQSSTVDYEKLVVVDLRRGVGAGVSRGCSSGKYFSTDSHAAVQLFPQYRAVGGAREDHQ